MWVGIGVGIGRNRFATGIFGAYASRVAADGGVTEAGQCVNAVTGLLLNASLLLIPSGYKANKLYSEIPTNGNGDLTWTRTSTAIRTNSSGLLESMGTGVPRLDYTYGSCPSVLLEPQRTNLALYSEQFNISGTWTTTIGGTGVTPTVTTNSTISPDGTQNAETIVFNRGAGNTISDLSTLQQNITIPTTGAYIFSVYAKASTAADVGKQVFLRLGGGGLLVSITLTQNWVRYSRAETSVASGSQVIQIGNRGTFTANNTVSVDLFGAQVEAGTYPTTYIPTTSATATRVADSFSRNNIYTNGLISASGGTWFVELRGNTSIIADNAPNGFWLGTSSTGTISNGTLYFRQGGGSQRTNVWKYESGTATQLYTTTTDTTKIAIKWNGSTADIFANGTKVVSATSFTATILENFVTTGVGRPFFIQQMALFSTPLSDTDCATLTT